MILGRNEGGKEGRTGLHRKVTQVKYSACIFGIRKRNTERLLHPPLLPSFPPSLPSPKQCCTAAAAATEAVFLSRRRWASLLCTARTFFRSLTCSPSIPSIYDCARGRSLVRLLLAPIRTMNDSSVLAPIVPNRR